MVPAAYGDDRPHATAGRRVRLREGGEERVGMDSLEANKFIAALLVAGIGFFLTGLIADNLVQQTPLKQTVLKAAGVPAAAMTGGVPKSAELTGDAPVNA